MIVLLTRPRGQNQGLVLGCERRQLPFVEMPLIQIVPIAPDQMLKQVVMDLDQYDAIIFISSNAVEWGMTLIDQYWPQLPRLDWYGVGSATAEELGKWDLQAAYPAVAGSEGLLLEPGLQNLELKKVLLVKGAGGRTLLSDTLRERGAGVTELIVYRREPIAYSEGALGKIFTPGSSGYVIITSGEAVQQFDQICPNELREQLVLIVPSNRVADLARGRGYPKVLDAGSPDAEEMLACIE